MVHGNYGSWFMAIWVQGSGLKVLEYGQEV